MFYVLESNPADPIVGTVRDVDDALVSRFTSGVELDVAQPRVTIELGVEPYPDYFELQQVPIVSRRFLDALRGASVENVIAYPVVLHEAERAVEGHSVLHVVGRIAAMDEQRSVVTKLGRQVVRMKRLALRPDLATALGVFRLHELESLIVVGDRVRDALAGLDGVLLSPADGWSDRHQF